MPGTAEAVPVRKRRVGVLGTFVWDTVFHPDRVADDPLEQWGGLAYCLSAFSAACPEGWAIVPVAKVGRDLADEAIAFLSSLGDIDPSAALDVVEAPNNRVELRYHDRAERTERLRGGVPPWTWEELESRLAGLDALYVNHMSGFEMDLGTATHVRGRFTGPIYGDLHSLFLEPLRGRPRHHRRLPDWEGWVASADFLQVNEVELRLLGPEGETPVSAHDLVRRGAIAAFVTRGAAGADFAVRERSPGVADWSAARKEPDRFGSVLSGTVPTLAGAVAGDPTGCGDIWGSVAFAGLLEGRALEASMRRAHVAAAARMRHGRIDGLVEVIASALCGYVPDA